MNIVRKEEIREGWSSDKKYCVTDEQGTRYLLRVSDIAQYDTKQLEFAMMKRVASLGVPMCRPIEFGVCEEGVYSIQSWIDGETVENIITTQTQKNSITTALRQEKYCSKFILSTLLLRQKAGKTDLIDKLMSKSENTMNVQSNIRTGKPSLII